jgi:hypothetical protein
VRVARVRVRCRATFTLADVEDDALAVDVTDLEITKCVSAQPRCIERRDHCPELQLVGVIEITSDPFGADAEHRRLPKRLILVVRRGTPRTVDKARSRTIRESDNRSGGSSKNDGEQPD